MGVKKIAIIVDSHIGSTLPLIRQFISFGYNVDYYILCCDKIGDREAINIKSSKTKLGIHPITEEESPCIFSYISSINFRLYYFSTLRPYNSIFGLRHIIMTINKLLIKKICKKINAENYFAINYVGRYNSEILMQIEKYIKCTNTITSLHEVCNHFYTNSTKPTKYLKYLFKNNKKIIVHSQKSYVDILKYSETNKDRIFHVNFGLFETYKTISEKNIKDLNVPYFLFYGFIQPYKGLNILYDAINLLSVDELDEYKIVVAGRGYDPILERMKNDNRFIVINRYISNAEIVKLNTNAKAIICPYLTVSQSGIIQTSLVFEKPIIASNIGSFLEFLEHKKTGLLFECGNSEDLANSILTLKNDQILYDEILRNIKKLEYIQPNFSWLEIGKSYIKIFNTEY